MAQTRVVALAEPDDISDTDDKPADADDRATDTSVGKALRLLDAFEDVDTSLGVSELARRTGIPKSTAFRLLAILEQHQLIERQDTRYGLGRRLFELGNRVPYCRPQSLRDKALPYISDLYEQTHETVHLAVLDGTDVLYVEKLFGHQQVKAPSSVGGRVPAYCSAIGKALLAWSSPEKLDATISRGLAPRTGYTIVTPGRLLDELRVIRERGVAFDREESRLGINCVASPIFSRRGQLVGGISVCGGVGRFAPDAFAGAVAQAARSIGTTIAA